MADSELQAKRQQAREGGGQAKIEVQHQKGKLTARERLERLCDAGSFLEIGAFVTHRAVGFGIEEEQPYGDGVVTGWAKIDNRPAYVYAQDFTVIGGSVGEAHGKKIARIIELAAQNGVPLIGINDSGGARIQEGVDSLAGYGSIFLQNVKASGVIPQISIILGPCAGGAVYSPAITDFIFMVDHTSHMFITGPDVIKAVTHEDVSFDVLGGADVHAQKSGVAHFTAQDEETLLMKVRWLLSFLPQNNLTPSPHYRNDDPVSRQTGRIGEIVPLNPQQPYDIHQVIDELVDGREFLEIQENYARNLVIGLARMDGNTVGIVANQPDYLAGVLDIDSSDKGSRFIRFCDSFHIPIVTLIDTPGFLPGVEQEHHGVIRHGAKLIYAYAEATVPKVSIILRKAYGGAYIVMNSKQLGGDMNFALPKAEIAVMGPEAAVRIVFRKELANEEDRDAAQKRLTEQYREQLTNPFIAAGRGYIDDIIDPSECRQRVILALEGLRDKRQVVPARKHGNFPV